ncbi:MAG: type II secretion system protein [Woeseia sp.]
MTRLAPKLPGRHRQTGLTLVEVLIAVSLLAVLMVPAMQALRNGFLGADIERQQTSDHHRLVARLEEVLAEPFGMLNAAAAGPTTASSYSDPPATPAGVQVYIAAYDADNADADDDPFTGTDDGVLRINVRIAGGTQSLATLRSR